MFEKWENIHTVKDQRQLNNINNLLLTVKEYKSGLSNDFYAALIMTNRTYPDIQFTM